MQRESRCLVPYTKDDIKPISSMNALTKDSESFTEYIKNGTFDNIAYSIMTLTPVRKRMMGKVKHAKLTLKRWY